MPCYDASPGLSRDALPVALRSDCILLPLYEYWASRRAGRAYPDRADISPHGLGPKLLPHIGMVEIDTGDMAASRMRLIGTAIVQELGFDPTGKPVRDYSSGEYLEFLLSLVREMLLHRRPVFSEAGFCHYEDRFVLSRRLYMPLSHGGSEPALLLFGQTFVRPENPSDLEQVTRVVL